MHGEWRIESTEVQNTTDGNELSAYKLSVYRITRNRSV